MYTVNNSFAKISPLNSNSEKHSVDNWNTINEFKKLTKFQTLVSKNKIETLEKNLRIDEAGPYPTNAFNLG